MSTQTVGVVPEFGVADRLRKAREHAGLEQGELADLMGVSRNTVSNNEKGRVVPRRIVVRAWAMATGVDATWLETGNAASQPEGPEGGVDECAHRDSNPEPAGYASAQVDGALVLPFRERYGIAAVRELQEAC